MIMKIVLGLLLTALVGITLWFLVYIIYGILDCGEEFTNLTLYFFHTNEYREHKPCLTFSQFISFYNVAPEKWNIEYETMAVYKISPTSYSSKYIYFTTHGDKYKYLRWRKKQMNYRKVLERNGEMSELVKAWRKDTASYQQKAYNEANKAYETILHGMTKEK